MTAFCISNLRTHWFLLLVLISGQTDAADYYQGKKIYANYCQECHGQNGEGNTAGVPDFSQGEGLYKSDTKLLDHIRDGSSFAPAFRATLTEREMLDTVIYLRSLH